MCPASTSTTVRSAPSSARQRRTQRGTDDVGVQRGEQQGRQAGGRDDGRAGHLAPGRDDGRRAVPVAPPVAVLDEVLGELGLHQVVADPGPPDRPVGACGRHVRERLVDAALLGGLEHVPRVEAERGVEQGEPLDALGGRAGQVHGDRAPVGVPEDRDPFETEVVEQGEGVGRRAARCPTAAPTVDRP